MPSIYQFWLALVEVQAHVKMAKMIPPPFHQRKCPTLHTEKWLLNTIFCMIAAEALEAVSMWVCS